MNEAPAKRKSSSFFYALGMFGTSIPINMFKTWALTFYVDKLALIDTTQFALITLLYTFLDAIDNPIYGFLSDRTRTRFGRRRPWLAIGAPLLILCYILFFNPPAALAPGSAFSYILLMYFLTGTLDSLINTNYGALFPELFPSEQERGKTNIIRHIFELLAMAFSIALTPVITEKLGYGTTALVYGLVALVVILLMTFTAHEDLSVQKEAQPGLWSTVKDIVKNPHFWIFGVTNGCYAAGIGLAQAVVGLYTKYYLGREDGLSSTILLGVFLVCAIVFMPVWGVIMRKLQVMKAWRIAFLCVTVTVLPLFFTKNYTLAAVAIAILGASVSGMFATMDLVGTKILDEDRLKNGMRREGLYNSLISILNKVSGLFTSLAYLLAGKVFGYMDGNNVGDRPDMAARFLLVIAPFVLFAAGYVLSHFLHFDEHYEAPVDAEKE